MIPSSHRRRPGGFTLVELLVVIAIIGVLVALLLPAVQAAREAARRMQCSNNLKQIALACHNYQSTYKQLPLNWDTEEPNWDANKNDLFKPLSWYVYLLPFIEQQPLYDSIDFVSLEGNWAPNNRVIRATPLSMLLCPSNTQKPVRANMNRGYNCGNCDGFGDGGGVDYVGNMGHHWGGWKDCGGVPDFSAQTGVNWFQAGGETGLQTPWVNGNWDIDQPRLQGFFYYRGSTRLDDALDGLSNTILVFEDMHWRGFNIGTGGVTGRPPALDRNPTPEACWMNPLAAVGNMRNPMNNKTPAWYGDHSSDPRCHGWSSNHPGGAQAAKADGSVRFYPQSIDHRVRYAISTKANGETVQEPQ